MTTARLLSKPLDDHWLAQSDPRNRDGRVRELDEDLVVDLGAYIPELHRWAVSTKRDAISGEGWIISSSARGNTIVRAPAGALHDGSSIPPWAGGLMGDEDDYEIAGVIHDTLYRMGAPRGPSDRVWRIVARSGSKNVSAWEGLKGWLALRLFGGGAWRHYREE